MEKRLTALGGETYKYHKSQLYQPTNIFQLIGSIVEGINETSEARRKVVREVINDTMTFKINLFEKLALHFSREALLMEKNRDNMIALLDMVTFNNKSIR